MNSGRGEYDRRLHLQQEIRISGLSVIRRVVGASHHFLHQGFACSIQLPTVGEISELNEPNELMYRVKGGGLLGGRPVYSYEIGTIFLRLDVPGVERLPRSYVDSGFRKGMTSKRGFELSKKAKRYEAVAEAAYSHWLDIVRWKSQKSNLEPRFSPYYPGVHSSLLCDSATARMVSQPPVSVTLITPAPLTLREWNSVQRTLEAGVSCPVSIHLLYQALDRYLASDQKGAAIDLAIAAESAVRTAFSSLAVKNDHGEVEKLFSQISMQRLIGSWKKLPFQPALQAALNKRSLNEVFRIRNGVVHRNSFDHVNFEARWSEMFSAVETLVSAIQKAHERRSRNF